MFLKLFCATTLCLSIVNGDCGIVSKKDWGGLEPVHVEYMARPLDLVIIQHTVTPSCSSDKDCQAMVRSIQDYFLDTLGYWDIGSSFYVGGNGKVYEGTGWLHVGAHTYGYNRKSIGISFIGNYNEDQPSDKMLDAVKALMKCGVEQGHLTQDFHVVGHRQLIATISPGKYVYSKIRTWPEWTDNLKGIKNN